MSDKKMLNLVHNNRAIDTFTPLDFFFKESKTKQKIDLFSERLRARIRKTQQERNHSQVGKEALKRAYLGANFLRKVATGLLTLNNFCQFKKSFKILNNLSPSSPEYIDEIAKIGNSLKKHYIDINIEDGIIENIAKSGDSTIFVLNHDNFQKDKFIYPIFNSFLNYAYSALGKQASCPRPQIIVSQNLLKLAGDRFRDIYTKAGLIPVDASMILRNVRANIIQIKTIIENLSLNKINLFIFPEGNNSVFKTKTLREKFQDGTARIILKTLEKKGSIRIVPLGLSYNSSKESMGSIHIGAPIILEKISNEVICHNADKLFTAGKTDESSTITRLSDILSTRLEEAVNLSKKNLRE